MEHSMLFEGERLDEVNEQIRLIQKKQGLTFGTDAFLLAAYVRRLPNQTAVELGGGTGIVSLLLCAKQKVKHIHVAEIQPAFAELIERNARLNQLSDRIFVHCRDIRELKPSELGGEVDLVVSNPPYMRCDSGKRNIHDEKYIARHEVMGGITDFCNAAGRLLRYGGKFVTVWRPDRLSELLYALHGAGMEAKRMTFVYADESCEPCAVLTEAVRGAAPAMRISSPLFLYEKKEETRNSRTLTPRAKEIYDTCDFDKFI